MCDLLCALPVATGGPTLFAKNSDRPPTERQLIERLAPRSDDGITPVTHVAVPAHPVATLAILGSRPAWGWGLEHGVNEAGVAAGNATIYTTLDPRPFPDGLTGMDLVRLALERAPTSGAAVEVIEQLIATTGQGGSGHDGARRPYWSSFLIADPTEAFVVETSGPTVAVEQVERTWATSNRPTIASFDAEHRHPRQPVAQLVDPRLTASRTVLAREPVTVAALEEHLRSHVGGDDGWTVCMHVDQADHQEATTASMVAELVSDGPSIVHILVGSPCEERYETRTVLRGTVGEGPAGGR